MDLGFSEEKSAEEAQTLKATPLWALHKERRGKMVPFAGYEMPVQYRRGIMEEHKQTRERAGLFDVSHMGQAFLVLDGEGGHEPITPVINHHHRHHRARSSSSHRSPASTGSGGRRDLSAQRVGIGAGLTSALSRGKLTRKRSSGVEVLPARR